MPFLSYGVVQVLLGGWRRSRSWVTMDFLVLVLVLVLVPLVSSFDKEPGLLELGLLAKYPEYQAVVRPFKKRNGGGLNFKRNGGVPDECRGKYDTSIYTQVNFSTYSNFTSKINGIL